MRLKETMMTHEMLDVRVGKKAIQSIYLFYSSFYFLIAPFEKRARLRSIELAEVRPDDRILEVGVGTGLSFVEFLWKVSPENTVFGLDLTPAMLEKTKRRAVRQGYSNFDLREGDARALPYPDAAFDLVYTSYMMDLIPTDEIIPILREYLRVLKTGGRLVMVNLSKKDRKPILWEKVYSVTPLLLGGCRPVMTEFFVSDAGFRAVQREFLPSLFLPTEIVLAFKLKVVPRDESAPHSDP